MATLHMMVGLPGNRKTTEAKKYNAFRLTPDEWQYFLYGHDISNPEHDERHVEVEELMWDITVKVLQLVLMLFLISDFGQNLNGMNSDERPMPLVRIPTSITWIFPMM